MTKINEPNKSFVPNVKNLPIKEYFASLPKAQRVPLIISSPKTDLIKALAELCDRDEHTIKRWVYGYSTPYLSEKKKVAAFLGCTVECLWPLKRQEEPAV